MMHISGVSKTFNAGTSNEVHALTDVSLELAEGSFLIIIGANGSGKSTILNAVAGSFEVDCGSLQLSGHNITKWPEYRRARFIGRVFQNPFSGTAPSMSIAENLALATRRGKSRGFRPALNPRVREELRDQVSTLNMGLEDRLDNPIGTLSGGQRQALTLLMASWSKPDLLLLDEHTAALDPKSADQVIELTHNIITRDKLTTLMVTHSMQQAANLGDRIIMMHRGRVLHDFHGSDRERIKAEDLLKRFEDVRRREQLGGSATDFLRSAKGATELLAIFNAIASVDAHIDAREIALIEEFATCWNLPVPNLTEGATEASADILTLRQCISNYLQISPPAEQATELLDVLHHFVYADESVSKEEEMLMEEITAMIMGYVTQSGDQGEHEVVIVPQTDEQRAAVLSILPGVEASSVRAGIVYSVGRFHSARYADMVCDQYVALGLFTTCIIVNR